MHKKNRLLNALFIFGIAVMIIGAVDPVEGSILILAGSACIAISTFILKNKQWKWYLYAFLAIVIGVFFLFYLSSLGGFGGDSKLSWWWGLLIIPYPAGWIFTMALLIIRALSKNRQTKNQKPLEG